MKQLQCIIKQTIWPLKTIYEMFTKHQYNLLIFECIKKSKIEILMSKKLLVLININVQN